ncbi:MAG: 4Fe-4S binding protein [Candidatus Methylarchaceae archaeon HK01B]|nr:4Fe-4S binding protein [Candidatus Methylarchaceae archaeon HK01B]
MRFRIEVVHPERCIGCYSCVYACSRHLFNTVDPSRTAVFLRIEGSITNPFMPVTCRFCKTPECAEACPKDALQPLPEGGIMLITSRCQGCETFDCITACAIRALALDKKTKLPVICDKCGDCAKYCPHNVFKYEEMK